MSRTPLFRKLKLALTKAHTINQIGPSGCDRVQDILSRQVSRRSFLKGGAILGATALLPSCGGSSSSFSVDDEAVKIAIIGGGMAGLHCAYRLKQSGIRAQVYEASSRIGGRMFTARGQFPQNQVAELGGEFIDTGHTSIISLADELGVALDDLSVEGTGEIYFFDGRILNEAEIVQLFRPVAARMAAAVERSDNDDAYFAYLDSLNIVQWLQNLGHADPLLTRLLSVAYTEEYGLAAEEQTVFNLLYLIDYETVDPFHVFGDSDERFHVRGGNDLIIQRLEEQLDGGQIETGAKLIAVNETASGYQITVDTNGGTLEKAYDIVVFALPFTLLREIALNVTLSDEKREVIANLGYGTNAKLIGGFRERVWKTQYQQNGSTITDNGLQTTWDSSRGQAGSHGIFTNFVGGSRGLEVGAGTAEEQYRGILPLIDQIFPEASTRYVAGSALRMHWPTAPFNRGSYACYRVGQARFSGIEGQSEGNLHFCGEHTSIDFQGYMEGACETGARAADEILQSLLTSPPTLQPTFRKKGLFTRKHYR